MVSLSNKTEETPYYDLLLDEAFPRLSSLHFQYHVATLWRPPPLHPTDSYLTTICNRQHTQIAAAALHPSPVAYKALEIQY